jgi:hypothetical protein
LCRTEYFDAIGQVIARISCGLGDVVQEQKIWRIAALRAMGRLLTPILGIDMAAPVAAASIATFGFSPKGSVELDDTIEQLTLNAVVSGSDGSLMALRKLISEQLKSAAESGAVKLSTAPVMVTISAGPPSNH